MLGIAAYIRQVDPSVELLRANNRVSEIDHRFLVKVDLRTIGGAGFSTRSRSSPTDQDGFGSSMTRF